MSGSRGAAAGANLEEVLRGFFLRAGFFVVRGVPLRFSGDDLTDVDLWLYERPTGTSRRVQICDIKYKQRPKAVERILWTRGLADLLDVDGAYVATTDRRAGLHAIAKRVGLSLIDGNDLAKMQSSQSLANSIRLSDEELSAQISAVDKDLRGREFQSARDDVLSSLSEGFGTASLVRALGAFCALTERAVCLHPESAATGISVRLAYLAASLVCASLDFVSVERAFRGLEERRELILKAVRFGALGSDEGQRAIDLALGLVEQYGASGRSTARLIDAKMRQDLQAIPAEIIADQAAKLLRGDQLFAVARGFEHCAYERNLSGFDGLEPAVRSMLGALLDYAGVDREKFAAAWAPREPILTNEIMKTEKPSRDVEQATLFKEVEPPENPVSNVSE